MDEADNATLWERFKGGGDRDARSELIMRYAPLVKYVVGRMAISMRGTLEPEDILAHGTVGLIDAVDRYDPRVGVKFETYAIQRVRGSILDALRKLNLQPRSVGRRMREIESAYSTLQEKLNRMPTDREVAEHLGMTPEEFDAALVDANCQVISLENTVVAGDDGEFLTLRDFIEDEESPNPIESFERTELLDALTAAIRGLPDRDQLVLSLYYHEELTLKEIAQVLRVSESRVSQLHAAALLKLRSWMRSMPRTAAQSGVR